MARTKIRKSQKSSDPQKEAKKLSVLLAKAMEHPGVKDVMQVYGEWNKANEVIVIYRGFQNPYPPNILNSSANPA